MLKRPEAAAVLKEFVVATLYTDKHTQYRDVMNKRFRSIALPLYVILGPDGQERARLAGRINLPQFLEFLKKGRNEATSKIHSDFDSALAAAKARGRPALIEFADFTSSLSLVMKETVLKNPRFRTACRSSSMPGSISIAAQTAPRTGDCSRIGSRRWFRPAT